MFDEEAEVSLSPGGSRIRVLRRLCVRWLSGSELGPVEIRRGADVSVVSGHLVRRISHGDAARLARALMSPSASAGRFARLVGDLMHRADPQVALANLLVDHFVMLRIEGPPGRWNGPGIQPRNDDPLLEPVPQQALTWVGVEVVDADEPARSFVGSQFRLRLPDGTMRTGALGDAGSVRVDDLEPGRCAFDLTDVPRDPPP